MQSELTCFLDVNAIFGVAGLWAEAHHVDGEDSEDILIPHDEIRYHTVGSSVLIKDCIPLLHRNHKYYIRFKYILYVLRETTTLVDKYNKGRDPSIHDVNHMLWPSQSSDLNPIECLSVQSTPLLSKQQPREYFLEERCSSFQMSFKSLCQAPRKMKLPWRLVVAQHLTNTLPFSNTYVSEH